MMKFEMYVSVVVRDKNGRIVKRLRRKCKSYVRQLIDHLNSFMTQGSVSSIDTGGATRTIVATSAYTARYMSLYGSSAGVTTHGVRVGTGTNAVAISDYALQTPIAEGTGAGQLTHGATSVGSPTTVGSSRQFTIARTFTNNSGASITVNEVGLYVETYDGTAYRYYMIERTLLTFAIANGASATVTYTIKVTV
jgi:hypothetical protein